MKLDEYIYRDKKKLRCGYTTGSCACAAAKAAAGILLRGGKITETEVEIQTPKGITLKLAVEEIKVTQEYVSCGVRKDSGDDADSTNGIMIYAKVSKTVAQGISITGGVGIGRITRQGLEQPVGNYAINKVPREMILAVVEAEAENAGYEGGLIVQIYAPEGVFLAKKTFNPSLGIKGGISILGTSGIVEPMSEKALVDTISLEMQMQTAKGKHRCIITPGNYGSHFIRDILGLDLSQAIKCSNFIGDTIDLAQAHQMKEILLVGHLGKLVKLGAGIMNTHSRYADGRMEVLTACALEADAGEKLLKKILQCITTDEAVALLKEEGILETVIDRLMDRIEMNLHKRAYEGLELEAVVFSNEHGLLGKTSGAEQLILEFRKEQNI